MVPSGKPPGRFQWVKTISLQHDIETVGERGYHGTLRNMDWC